VKIFWALALAIEHNLCKVVRLHNHNQPPRQRKKRRSQIYLCSSRPLSWKQFLYFFSFILVFLGPVEQRLWIGSDKSGNPPLFPLIEEFLNRPLSVPNPWIFPASCWRLSCLISPKNWYRPLREMLFLDRRMTSGTWWLVLGVGVHFDAKPHYHIGEEIVVVRYSYGYAATAPSQWAIPIWPPSPAPLRGKDIGWIPKHRLLPLAALYRERVKAGIQTFSSGDRCDLKVMSLAS